MTHTEQLSPPARKCWAAICLRTDTRPYPSGPACPDHTPAAMAGRPEPAAPEQESQELSTTLA